MTGPSPDTFRAYVSRRLGSQDTAADVYAVGYALLKAAVTHAAPSGWRQDRALAVIEAVEQRMAELTGRDAS